jgi:hypothetical protein
MANEYVVVSYANQQARTYTCRSAMRRSCDSDLAMHDWNRRKVLMWELAATLTPTALCFAILIFSLVLPSVNVRL